MDTRLPVSGKRVADKRSRGDRLRRRRRHGMAMIAVVAVLVLLTIVATPFLLTQRDSAARGERYLYEARATMEAESLFEMVRSHLTVSLEHLERSQLDRLGAGARAEATDEGRLRATPSSDTLAEFQLPEEVLARFNRVSAKNQRIWDVEVVDQQARFNLNNCSYPVLANILGRTRLVEALSVDDENRMLVDDASQFPEENGLVRIGNEVIKYETRMGNELVGLERGYKSNEPANGSVGEWEAGDIVIDEAAFQLAIRPFRADPQRFVRYTNVYQAREIASLGMTALQAADFDKLRRYTTVWNGNIVGDGWVNPQLVRNNLSANDATQLYVRMKNVAYFGIGTVVRITDGVNDDYGIVTKVRGANEVLIAGEIRHDYEADNTRIYGLARSPINVNTADVDILKHVFWGLRLRGKSTDVNENTASELAYFLKNWIAPMSDEFGPERAQPEQGVYRDWEDLIEALEAANEQGMINDDELNAIVRNALNANDSRLAFSTVPFVFRSFDTYEVRATASILGMGGRELARRELRRVFEASTSRSGTFVIESQDDFLRQLIKSRDGKYWTSFPDNINARYDGQNIPASELFAFRQQGRFPSRDRSPAVGDMKLLPGATRYVGRTDRFFHFDSEDIPDGLELEENPFFLVATDTYSTSEAQLDIVEVDDVPLLQGDVELGVQTFSGQFWYRPRWTRDGTDRVLFDYSQGDEFHNYVRIAYDGRRDMLVLSVADATEERSQVEVFYDFAFTEWEADQWYHFAFSVNGGAPGLNELFIDGEKVGVASHITRLSQSVPPTGDIQQLLVDDASSFPEAGTLLVHGTNGMELIEYDGLNDNGFNVVRRKARSIDTSADDSEPRAHSAGDIVELYGFAGPLFTDARPGGATLQGQIGPQRVYRLHYATETEENWQSILTGGAPAAVDGDILVLPDPADPSLLIPLAAGLGNPANPQLPIQGITLSEWDTGDTTASIIDDIGSEGTRGIGMIVSRQATVEIGGTAVAQTEIGPGSVSPQDEPQAAQIGGAELVVYTVTGTGEIQLDERNVDLNHVGSTPGDNGFGRFHITYNYRDEGEPGSYRSDDDETDGSFTAFIPIAILAEGDGESYLNPVDEETQLGNVNNRFAYLQIDGEWIRYDSVDTETVAGFVAFYRDQALDDVANLFGVGGTLETFDPSGDDFSGPSGAQFDVPTNDAVAPAQSVNTGDSLPASPTANNSTPYLPPPENIRTQQILDALDFRGYVDTQANIDQRIANTDPAEHDTGAVVNAAFLLVPGNDVTTFGPEADAARGAFPGFNDLITLRDADFRTEQFRAQWGYRGWVAPTQPLTQTWRRERPQDGFLLDLRQYDSRAFVRALKFPSGELPDAELTSTSERATIGGTDDGFIPLAPATIDEVVFWEQQRPGSDRPSYALLGEVPEASTGTGVGGGAVQPPEFDGIDEEASEIVVHMPYFDSGAQALFSEGLPIDDRLFAEDGGCIVINDELIYYEEFDPQTGEFLGCQRGVMGTQPQPHSFGSRVAPIHAFPFSRLVSDADETSAEFQLQDARDFPDDGYLRIADQGEIVGYTELQGNSLSGPLGRIDPTTERDESDRDARVGGALFRGRYGTEPVAYRAGDLVMGMPFRHYDRFAERADHPEQAYVQLSWRKEGAIWKRITWDEQPIENADVLALVRFSGGPAWDTSDRIIRVGQEPMPNDDRRKYIYEIADPKAENLLNIEADRVEVRIHVRFAQGAYDRFADVAPNAWKETPWIKKVVVEYVAPPTVLSQE